jgi:hypothetical protein
MRLYPRSLGATGLGLGLKLGSRCAATSESVGGCVESGPEISLPYARGRGGAAFHGELEIRFYFLCVRCRYKNR